MKQKPLYRRTIIAVAKSNPTQLRFTNNSNSESSVSFTGLSADIRYKLNGTGGYTQWDGSTITLQPGEIVEMVGDNATRISVSSQHFEIDGQLAASGSVMSLVSSSKIIKTIPQVDGYFAYLFYGCTGLTAAPELPATALANDCYGAMFSGCTGLTSIEVSFEEWLDGATYDWVDGVAASGTFTCPAALPEELGSSYIPEDWTIVTK